MTNIKNIKNLTGDKGALLLEPVANGSDGGDIHEPETETTHNPIRDLSENYQRPPTIPYDIFGEGKNSKRVNSVELTINM